MSAPFRALALLVVVAFGPAMTATAQMDMLPFIFRDIPPELEQGIPADMTFEEFQILNRNIDFFTVGMSMLVPGYGFLQVDRPKAAAAVIVARTVGYGMMTGALISQWRHLQDLGNLSDLSSRDFERFKTNAFLFGGGVMINFVGWGVDVLGAYHLAKKDRDFVIYKYGLRKTLQGRPEPEIITYARKLEKQTDKDRRVEDDLRRTLLVYLEDEPFGTLAAEMEHNLGALYEELGSPQYALLHYGRAVFVQPVGRHAFLSRRAALELLNARHDLWAADWNTLHELFLSRRLSTEESDSESRADRYRGFVERLQSLESPDLAVVALQEARRFLRLFPDAPGGDRILFGVGLDFLTVGQKDSAAAAFGSLASLYPESPLAPEAAERARALR